MTKTLETQKQSLPQTTPAQLLAIAVDKDADIDKLTKLMELQERWEANEARKAYVQAMNEFKASPPEIFKDSHVGYRNKDGTLTEYDHATLSNVVAAISTALSKHNLSHRWDVDQLDGGMIKVTCVITHALGHCERVPMQSGPDQSGKKNNIQAIGSTTTYLQRYTLLAATGLATKEQDNDGDALETISEDQLSELEAIITNVDADKVKFLEYLGVEELSDLPALKYTLAINALNKKGKKK